jgi:drug/metabolite transporter (DMT)-like permease
MIVRNPEQKDQMNRIVGIGYANLATFVWATNMVLGRFLKDSIGPVMISAVRFSIASIIFAMLLRKQPPEERCIGEDRWLLVGMAIAGVVLFSPALYLGLRYTTVVNCSLINALTPLVTGLFATLIIKEPMTRRQISGAIAAFIGVVFLISNGSLVFWKTAHFNAGDFIVLVSVVIWGMYAVLGSKVMRRRSAVSATAFSTFMGVPILFLLAIWELQSVPVEFDFQVILILIYIGVVPSAVGFYAWNTGLARIGPNNATVFYNTLPLYGVLLGFLFLGEPIGTPHLVGGILIIGGGIWATRPPHSVANKER